MFTLASFYNSPEWKSFRKTIIQERLARDGEIVCAHCKKPILQDYDIIAHHCTTHLTEANVNDFNISLNPENIQLVHHRCHNTIHERFGHGLKKVYVVFGSPGAGKSTYVSEVMDSRSIVLDIDAIYKAINGDYRDSKLLGTVMDVWNTLLDVVRTRKGQWTSAYIVCANCRNVERLQRQFDAELVHIDTDYKECLKRAQPKIEKYGEAYKKAIDDFFIEWNETYSKIIDV